MEIYSIEINRKTFAQYKTYEDALTVMNKLIKENPNSNIKIILEDFCEYGHMDTCCKINLLCEYNDFVLKKYL